MIVYKTFSFVQAILYFLLRIGYASVAAVALYHYHENPVLVIAVVIVCIIFLLVTGTDEIVVYSDAIIYKSGSLFKAFRKQKVFKIADIKSINVEGSYSTGDELYNPTMTTDRPLNEIKIEFTNGEISIVKTNIYINKLKEAIAEIEKLVRK